MDASLSEIARIFDRQGAARGAVRATTADVRVAKLQRLKGIVLAHAQDAVVALGSDLGKPPFEAVFDFGAAVAEIDEVIANLHAWMKPRDVTVGPRAAAGASAQIVYQSRGRILIFGPWNFPFSLLFQPLAGAIAAGNTVVLKPSELAPATAALSAKIIAEVFSADEVAIFQGGVDVATALLELPFDHIFFTGSTHVGRRVMAAAAKHLSSVTLELGGKCPVVIDRGTDMQRAAERVAWGKFLNAGQICLAPDHVWLPADCQEEFAVAVGDYLTKAYSASGEFNRADFARIIDVRNYARVTTLRDEAVSQGAKIVTGGSSDNLFIEPTVMIHVQPDSAIMQEEIFGPLLPILTYDDTDALIDHLNAQPKPLALYVFSDRQPFIDKLVAETSSGGVTINDVIQHAAETALPFGGVGASGIGCYHGHYSFLEMSHARSIYRQAEDNPSEAFFRPPYGQRLPV